MISGALLLLLLFFYCRLREHWGLLTTGTVHTLYLKATGHAQPRDRRNIILIQWTDLPTVVWAVACTMCRRAGAVPEQHSSEYRLKSRAHWGKTRKGQILSGGRLDRNRRRAPRQILRTCQ